MQSSPHQRYRSMRRPRQLSPIPHIVAKGRKPRSVRFDSKDDEILSYASDVLSDWQRSTHAAATPIEHCVKQKCFLPQSGSISCPRSYREKTRQGPGVNKTRRQFEHFNTQLTRTRPYHFTSNECDDAKYRRPSRTKSNSKMERQSYLTSPRSHFAENTKIHSSTSLTPNFDSQSSHPRGNRRKNSQQLKRKASILECERPPKTRLNTNIDSYRSRDFVDLTLDQPSKSRGTHYLGTPFRNECIDLTEEEEKEEEEDGDDDDDDDDVEPVERTQYNSRPQNHHEQLYKQPPLHSRSRSTTIGYHELPNTSDAFPKRERVLEQYITNQSPSLSRSRHSTKQEKVDSQPEVRHETYQDNAAQHHNIAPARFQRNQDLILIDGELRNRHEIEDKSSSKEAEYRQPVRNNARPNSRTRFSTDRIIDSHEEVSRANIRVVSSGIPPSIIPRKQLKKDIYSVDASRKSKQESESARTTSAHDDLMNGRKTPNSPEILCKGKLGGPLMLNSKGASFEKFNIRELAKRRQMDQQGKSFEDDWDEGSLLDPFNKSRTVEDPTENSQRSSHHHHHHQQQQQQLPQKPASRVQLDSQILGLNEPITITSRGIVERAPNGAPNSLLPKDTRARASSPSSRIDTMTSAVKPGIPNYSSGVTTSFTDNDKINNPGTDEEFQPERISSKGFLREPREMFDRRLGDGLLRYENASRKAVGDASMTNYPKANRVSGQSNSPESLRSQHHRNEIKQWKMEGALKDVVETTVRNGMGSKVDNKLGVQSHLSNNIYSNANRAPVANMLVPKILETSYERTKDYGVTKPSMNDETKISEDASISDESSGQLSEEKGETKKFSTTIGPIPIDAKVQSITEAERKSRIAKLQRTKAELKKYQDGASDTKMTEVVIQYPTKDTALLLPPLNSSETERKEPVQELQKRQGAVKAHSKISEAENNEDHKALQVQLPLSLIERKGQDFSPLETNAQFAIINVQNSETGLISSDSSDSLFVSLDDPANPDCPFNSYEARFNEIMQKREENPTAPPIALPNRQILNAVTLNETSDHHSWKRPQPRASKSAGTVFSKQNSQAAKRGTTYKQTANILEESNWSSYLGAKTVQESSSAGSSQGKPAKSLALSKSLSSLSPEDALLLILGRRHDIDGWNHIYLVWQSLGQRVVKKGTLPWRHSRLSLLIEPYIGDNGELQPSIEEHVVKVAERSLKHVDQKVKECVLNTTLGMEEIHTVLLASKLESSDDSTAKAMIPEQSIRRPPIPDSQKTENSGIVTQNLARPITGGKSLTPEQLKVIYAGFEEEVDSESEYTSEEESVREGSPLDTTYRCQFLYHVKRRECLPSEDIEDKEFIECGTGYNSLTEANAAASQEFGKDRIRDRKWPLSEWHSYICENYMMQHEGLSKDGGQLQIIVDRSLALWGEGVPAEAKAGSFARKVYDICIKKTVTARIEDRVQESSVHPPVAAESENEEPLVIDNEANLDDLFEELAEEQEAIPPQQEPPKETLITTSTSTLLEVDGPVYTTLDQANREAGKIVLQLRFPFGNPSPRFIERKNSMESKIQEQMDTLEKEGKFFSEKVVVGNQMTEIWVRERLLEGPRNI